MEQPVCHDSDHINISLVHADRCITGRLPSTTHTIVLMSLPGPYAPNSKLRILPGHSDARINVQYLLYVRHWYGAMMRDFGHETQHRLPPLNEDMSQFKQNRAVYRMTEIQDSHL